MKLLNSWISAVVVCSAIASQANADVLMLASGDSTGDTFAVTNVTSFVGVGNVSVETKREKSQASSAFVPGSLINKSNQGTWLMSQSVQHEKTARQEKVSLRTVAGRGQKITPTLPTGTETRPVSTFAQFVQIFKHTQNSQDELKAVHATVGDEIAPKTSSMAFIGLFASGLAGITGLVTASRRGFFLRAAR